MRAYVLPEYSVAAAESKLHDGILPRRGCEFHSNTWCPFTQNSFTKRPLPTFRLTITDSLPFSEHSLHGNIQNRQSTLLSHAIYFFSDIYWFEIGVITYLDVGNMGHIHGVT